MHRGQKSFAYSRQSGKHLFYIEATMKHTVMMKQVTSVRCAVINDDDN